MAGRPEDVSDITILSVFMESTDPALFSTEVADELTIKRNGTLRRLNDLSSRNLINKKKVGTCVMWWISEEGRKYVQDKS